MSSEMATSISSLMAKSRISRGFPPNISADIRTLESRTSLGFSDFFFNAVLLDFTGNIFLSKPESLGLAAAESKNPPPPIFASNVEAGAPADEARQRAGPL